MIYPLDHPIAPRRRLHVKAYVGLLITIAFSCVVQGGVINHADVDSWNSAVGRVDYVLSFDEVELNEQITTQYQGLGVRFSGEPAAPFGNNQDLFNNQALIDDVSSTIQVDFETPLKAVALDVWGAVSGGTTALLFSGRQQVAMSEVPPGGKTPEGRLYSFFAYEFTEDTTIDRILLDPGPGPQNGIGLDNLRVVSVPEPSARLLAGMSMLLPYCCGRKRQRMMRA